MRLHLFATVAVIALPIAFGCSAAGGDKGGASLDGTDPGAKPGGPGGGDAGTDTGFHVPGGDPDGGLGGIGDASGPPLDPTKDNDGDGYVYADDCDDTNKLINPGAYDVIGDKVDNDCNGTVDDVDACDTGLKLLAADGLDFAKSLHLCRQTTEAATGKSKTWGVISAVIQTVDGTDKPLARQIGLEPNWGTAGTMKAKEGETMVVLSTGSARVPGQPEYMKPLDMVFGDKNTGHENTPPAGWPKNTSGCPSPATNTANDSVSVKLKIRVPTNASSFAYDFDFYSSEYIDFVCSSYNDTYVALLTTKAPLDPKNAGNISFDATGGPVNVNSGFFEVCTPGSAASGKSFACKLGTGELAGTGFEGDGNQDGATSWLRTKAGVVPGEIIELTFAIWNTGDHILQSTILLDNFQWDATPTTGGPVTDRPK
ncbi:MAG: hypothetical protein NVSMB47_04040 [Polyangiales bacterium]